MALAINETGKWVSERHHMASQTKMTAGDAAKELRKQGIQISAKQLVQDYELLTGMTPEWHHSGFYRPNGKSRKTMGRTFFFTIEQITIFANEQDRLAELKVEIDKKEEAAKTNIVKGFYYIWESDYAGYRGKKRNFKVLKTYEGMEAQQPANFTSLSDEAFQNAKAAEGKAYYGWDEPRSYEFN